MSIVAKKIMMGSGATEDLPSDDQFNRVSFLSHFDGSNDGVNNAFDDGSASNHTITANGNVTQGSFGPFAKSEGYWATAFDGVNDYLSVADSDDFYFEGGDWTIEAFVFVRSLPGSNPAIVSKFDGGGSRDWSVELYGPTGNGYTVLVYLETTGDIAVFSSTSVALNTWNHIAIVGTHSDRTMRMYLNGSLDSNTLNYSATLANTSEPLRIGVRGSSEAYDFDGEISNLRIVKGTAVYSGSSFTVPTAPLTAITNTKLLTCQSNRFVDNSASGHTVTPSGNAAVTAFGPFLTDAVYDPAVNGASASFDGTGDYLQAANSADWDLGTGNFTWECYAYITDITRTQWFFSVFHTGSGQNAWGLRLESNGTLNAYFDENGDESVSTIGVAAANSGLTENAWHHIAVVKNGTGSNNIQIYVDGASKVTGTFGAIFDTNLPFRVGRQGNDTYAQYFLGQISNIRIIKGTALYTGNFTPPTAPLTAVTNTKLLLNMADGQAIDQVAKSNIALEGNAVTSTAQKKFGTASFYSPGGDGDKGLINTSGGALLPAYNWTIEAWTYCTNSAANQVVFAQGLSGGGGRVALGIEGGVYLLQIGSAKPQHNARTLNQWVHLCATYDGTTAKLYIDGTLASSGSVSYTTATDQNLQAGIGSLGTGWDTSAYGKWYGYIDELRVSRFIRYTSNFTAPSEPFADKGQ